MKRLLLGVWFSAVITSAILSDPSQAVAAPGDLDPTFGTNGVATDNLGRKATVHKVLTQPDGKIVVVGTWKVLIQLNQPPEDRVFVRRYTAAGALDQSFGLGRPGIGFDAALQSDGKIVVLGRAPNTITSFLGTVDTISPVVWRFNTNGTIDTGFGNNGTRFISLIDAPASRGNYHIGVFNDQIFVGYAARSPFVYPSTFRYKVSRISAIGAIDFTITPPFKFIADEKAFAMKVEANTGDIIVVGPRDTNENSVVRRYTPDGALDSGFGTNGEAAVPDCGSEEVRPKDVVVQPDGKILVHRFTGYNNSVVVISRLLDGGSADRGFQCAEWYLPPAIGDTLYLQPDGKFFIYAGLVAGAIRSFPDGSSDGLFNGVTYFPSAIQPDQKIVEAHAVYPNYTSISISRRLLD